MHLDTATNTKQHSLFVYCVFLHHIPVGTHSSAAIVMTHPASAALHYKHGSHHDMASETQQHSLFVYCIFLHHISISAHAGTRPTSSSAALTCPCQPLLLRRCWLGRWPRGVRLQQVTTQHSCYSSLSSRSCDELPHAYCCRHKS
jgi:hypothetical protein